MQPFLKLEADHIDRLIQLKRTWIVVQSYPAGKLQGVGEVKSLLLTDYDDPGLAKVHLNALRDDNSGSIADLRNPQHEQRLRGALKAPSQFTLYWAVVKSKEQLQHRLDAALRRKIHRYVEANTDWKIPLSEKLGVHFEVIFGELFLRLNWRNRRPRIRLSEIERY